MSLDFLKMDQELSSKQKLARDKAKEILAVFTPKKLSGLFESEKFPAELPELLGSSHLIGSYLECMDQFKMDAIGYGLVMTELERIDSGVRSFASVQGALVMHPIEKFGTEKQKQEWLPGLKSGKLIGGFALTEPHSGSDPGSMKTYAKKIGTHWHVQGSKKWVTNGPISDVLVVWAKTDQGIRGFLVPTASKGVQVTKIENKLSLRISSSSEVVFNDVQVAEHSMLPKAQGLKAALGCLSEARYGIAWGAIGAAEACFDEAKKVALGRKSFGKPLSSKQLVQVKFAKMLRDIELARLLAWRLGTLKNKNLLSFDQVSMAKQNNVEMALSVARTCRDILGANGILSDHVSMRHLCNLETVSTYEGTSDIHLLIVGSKIFGTYAF